MGNQIGWEEGGAEWRDICPYCGHTAFLWNIEKGKGFCFFCEKIFHSRPSGLDVNNLLQQPNYLKTIAFQNAIEHPSMLPLASSNNEAVKFLKHRKVSTKDADTMGIRFSEKYDRIYFPVTPLAPEYNPSYMFRHIYKKLYGSVWGLKKKLGGYIHKGAKEPLSKAVIIVEGAFDVLSPDLSGYAIATLGTQMNVTQKLWLSMNFKKVFIWYDPDALNKSYDLAQELKVVYDIDAEVIEHSHEPGDCACYNFLEELKEKVLSYK